MMKKIVTILIMLTEGITVQSQVKIIAHRGASYWAPENTVASANLAWEKGADAVETDIYLSKDNRIICIHDANTKRTTGQDHKISETSYITGCERDNNEQAGMAGRAGWIID